MTNTGRAAGIPLDYVNADSPYYVGSQWSFLNGGEPQFKRGGDVVMTGPDGTEYTAKDLKKLKRRNPEKFAALFTYAKNEEAQKVMDEINSMRVDTEGSEEVITYTDSGNVDWIENLKNDPEYQDAFYNEYVNYRKAKKKGPKNVLSKEEFIENYIKFQQQNRWMNENLSQEDLSNPGWDRLYEYTPCGPNDKGCVTIDGKKWKKGTDKKDPNWRYKQAMDEAGMEAFDEDMVSHMQAGFIGGKILELDDNDKQQLYATGVDDQTITLNGQTFSISGDDGFYGNTTNRELQGNVNVTPAVEAVPCSNAAEMEAACTEAGGTWTPYTPAVTDENGSVTTPASGCECDKQINITPQTEPTPKDTPFWLQDELGLANARDAKLSLQKRYPWSPFYNQPEIDAVFKDPTREIAAIGEQAAQAAEVAKSFGSGAGRGMAAALAAQGEANKAIANAINQVQSDNVTVANQMNIKNAELEYKTQMLNNNEKKQLYDNTVLVEENYDNALRKANAAITQQLQNAYTNRANTANLNSIYPQFDIDPSTGGIINITDPKAFYADPNYTDPKTAIGEYAAARDEYFKTFQTYDGFPDFEMPDNSKAGQTTTGQQLTDVITNAGYQGGARTGKEMRILRSGAELRNFFLPFGK